MWLTPNLKFFAAVNDRHLSPPKARSLPRSPPHRSHPENLMLTQKNCIGWIITHWKGVKMVEADFRFFLCTWVFYGTVNLSDQFEKRLWFTFSTFYRRCVIIQCGSCTGLVLVLVLTWSQPLKVLVLSQFWSWSGLGLSGLDYKTNICMTLLAKAVLYM